MNRLLLPAVFLGSLVLGGCVNVKTAPIEVKPIHITVDVNVKVAKALDDFFGDLDKKSATINPEEKK
jgi:outer membrane murein-binding lipoprotein Lpp